MKPKVAWKSKTFWVLVLFGLLAGFNAALGYPVTEADLDKIKAVVIAYLSVEGGRDLMRIFMNGKGGS